MIRQDYELTDRYLATAGEVFLTGVQALARVPIEQLRRDHARGHRSAALISGYPGSPLGTFDLELARALKTVPELPITHLPAVNEELGASAVMGSQLVATRPDQRYDGVVGIWYGKAPGLDRATDALRHGVFAGANPAGGALAIVGDDPAAKSSTMPSSSDGALLDLHMPVLYPSTIAECIELGLHGIAMSRATGLWSGLKIVTPIADGNGTVTFPALDAEPIIPTIEIDGRTWRCSPSAQFLGPRMVAVEEEFVTIRAELARRYGIDNGLNRVTTDPGQAWLGIISTGFTYAQVIETFRRLGFADLKAVEAAGIRLLQLRMPVPFDADAIVDFARDVDEVFVIEEKKPTLERLVRDALYESAIRPRVIGKRSPDGSRILPSHGRLDADAIEPALRSRLEPVLGDRLAPPPPKPREMIPLTVNRAPFFCSGCPHNWGMKVPDGSVVGMGTGCHGMGLLMNPERVGDSIGVTAMGNEGAQWLGMAPFVETDHIVQNYGDGTYFHSGQLAIQAAIGAGANVTFKILYNHTVAMTGGQDATHQVGPGALATILLAHGAERVAITTDDVGGYDRTDVPSEVDVIDRTKIVEVQTELARTPGVTILIHDQGCAAELRRDRKRGLIEAPTRRVVINHRICEGCGDCGDVSNCLSVQPIDTPLGRKTQIDQASCNFDYSCLQGDCPAFMTVEVDPTASGGQGLADPASLPIGDPPPAERDTTIVRFTGIGGTGVVTAAQIVATAAMLAGFDADGLDQTGLSQKAGPVISDLTISPAEASRRSNLVGAQQADVVIAFDELVAASALAIEAAGVDTAVIASSSSTPTGAQVADPSVTGHTPGELEERLRGRVGRGNVFSVDASQLATALTGSAATANLLLVGAAVQSGQLPVPVEAIQEAIGLNGVAIDANRAAFEWGRRAFAEPERVAALASQRGAGEPRVDQDRLPAGLDARIEAMTDSDSLATSLRLLAADLVSYQDDAYAARYLDLVELALEWGGPGFATAVARNFHKLLAYKDEYEVARLMLRPDGVDAAAAVGAGRAKPKVTYHLHPPMLKALGLDRKIEVGPRTRPVFRALAKGKRLRGNRLDPFGWAELRRVERRLVDTYERGIERVCGLAAEPVPATVEAAIALADLPDGVRGYEELKLRRAAAFEAAFAEGLRSLS